MITPTTLIAVTQSKDYGWLKAARMSLLITSSLTVTACANLSAGNLFSHYSAQNQDIYQEVERGDYQNAELELVDSEVGGPILSNMEKGRVSFLAANYPNSFSAFQLSDEAYKTLAERATVSVSEGPTKSAH